MTTNFFRAARESYVSVRKQTPLYSIHDSTLVAWLFSARISPFFTAMFLKYRIRPNAITLLMIIFGLLGAILFAVDNALIKVTGYIFIQLWFVMDCSDGEVARITKDYSRYGTEMDFLAHILTHPAFQTSFLVSALQLYSEQGIEPIVLIGVFTAIIVVELMIRGILGIELIAKLKDPQGNTATAPVAPKNRKILGLLFSAVYSYPNVALLFPIIYFVDLLFGSRIGFYYAIVVLALSLPMMARFALSVLSKLRKYPALNSPS